MRWLWVVLLAALLVPLAVLASLPFTAELRFEPLVANRLLWRDLGTTLQLAAGAALLAVGFAAPAAWWQARYDFFGRRLLSWLLILPLAIPAYVLAYVYADLTRFAGPLQTALQQLFALSAAQTRPLALSGLSGGILMFALALYPYVYLLMRRSIAQHGDSALEAARTLGASRREALLRVVLPLLWPALVMGGGLVALECLADLGVAELLGIRTLALRIKHLWLNKGELGSAALVALLLLLISLLTFALLRLLQRYEPSARIQRPVRRLRLRGAMQWLAVAYQGLLLTFGFGFPLVWLLAQQSAFTFPAGLWGAMGGSLSAGAWVASTGLILAVALLASLRFARTGVKALVMPLASYGYGTPGLVLALGCIAPIFLMDRLLANGQALLGLEPRALLAPGLFALVFALSVRLLAVALAPLDSAYQRIPLASDWAARTLGVSRLALLFRNHIPQLGPALATAFLFLFVETLKELPATLLARPPGFETLATRFFALAADERIYEAAPYALMIVLLLLPFVLLFARSGR